MKTYSIIFFIFFYITGLSAQSTVTPKVITSLLIDSEERFLVNWKKTVKIQKSSHENIHAYIHLMAPENYRVIHGEKISNNPQHNYRLKLNSHFDKFEVEIKGRKEKTISEALLFIETSPIKTRVFLGESCVGLFDIHIPDRVKSKKYLALTGCHQNKNTTTARISNILRPQLEPSIITLKNSEKDITYQNILSLSLPSKKPIPSSSTKHSFSVGLSFQFHEFQNSNDLPNIAVTAQNQTSLANFNFHNQVGLSLLSLKNNLLKENKALSIKSHISHDSISFKFISRDMTPYLGLSYNFIDKADRNGHSFLGLPIGLDINVSETTHVKPSFTFLSSKPNFFSFGARADFLRDNFLYFLNFETTRFDSGSTKKKFYRFGGGVEFYY